MNEHPYKNPWRTMPKWCVKESDRIIFHLHQKEQELLAEIAGTQVYHWTAEQIKARFG